MVEANLAAQIGHGVPCRDTPMFRGDPETQLVSDGLGPELREVLAELGVAGA